LLEDVLAGAEQALGAVTEESIVDGLEAAVQGIAATLGLMAARLPETPEECERALQTWQALSAGAHEADGGSPGRRERRLLAVHSTARGEPPPSKEEALQLMLVAKAVLSDVHTALAEVSRDEIEEIAEVALTVTRLALAGAQRALRQVRAEQSLHVSGVVIEDLGGVSAGGGAGQASDSGAAGVRGSATAPQAARTRRPQYAWTPLWPRLLSWATSARPPSALTRRVNPLVVGAVLLFTWPALLVSCVVVFLFTWPLWLLAGAVAAWVLAVLLPMALLADLGLRRLYLWRSAEVDDFVQGAAQVCRLWYLSARLAARRCRRFARAQVQRISKGRPIAEVVEGCFRSPVESARAVAQEAARVALRLCGVALSLARAKSGGPTVTP